MGTTTAPTGFGRAIWNAIKGGNQVHGVGLVPVSVSFSPPATGTYSVPIFTAPTSTLVGSWKVEAASITWAGGDVATHATDYWSFQLRAKQDTNKNGSVDRDQALLGTAMAFTPAGVTLREFAPIKLDVSGPEAATPLPVFLQKDDTLSLDATDVGGGSPQDMSGLTVTVTVFLRHSPPGR